MNKLALVFGWETRIFLSPCIIHIPIPLPMSISEEPLIPQEARWQDRNGSPMALLRYEDVRNPDNPGNTDLDFLESTYRGKPKKAGWKIDELKVPDLNRL